VTPSTLARTYAAAFRGQRGWSESEFATLLGTSGVILRGDGRSFILGRVTLDEAEVLTLATDPAHRRKGLARAVLAAFETAAVEAGAAQVFLEVAEDNQAARGLYAAAGYVAAGRRPGYYPAPGGPSVAALILRKTLAAA
jgi:ribosomal-protein-alanine N-acetyltransferase